MGYAYTPGLSVAECTVIRKVRRLPLKGQVLVKVGQEVAGTDVVAQTDLPGEVRPINVVGKLGISPEELPEIMLKREGEALGENEPFARTKGFFGLFKSEIRSPIEGTLESISKITGQVIIRGKPTALRKTAFARGRVVAVQPEESATVEITGTFIQGIFGIGGETHGELVLVTESPDDILDADRIRPQHAGKIIVGGSLVTAEAVRAAAETGVCGIVCGGLNDADLRDFLGYELGVAITGEESLGVTLVITEGFGRIGMAHGTFELLKKRTGLSASINGATQIRAGVIRPEVIIPLDEKAAAAAVGGEEDSVLQVGTPLRAIRDPYFGRIGQCVDLPVELVRLPSETKVRVLKVRFEDGAEAILPRANVELIKR
ncbi:MAG: hypothetical protein IPM18_09675 [Phycisphaerales bacterium]|nr:hypothetical protein [Phycisphaerales bacterium]